MKRISPEPDSPTPVFMLARILWDSAVAVRNYKLSRPELQQLQDRKVRRLMKYCYENVPFYHDMFLNNGLGPEEVRGVRDLGRLPHLMRGTILENYPERITAKRAKVGLTLRTSGTTGRPLQIQWGRRFCDSHQGLHTRRALVQRVRPWDKVALVFTGETPPQESVASSAGTSLSNAYRLLFGSFNARFPVLRQRTFFFGRKNQKEVADSLFDFRPDVLYARPSHARRLGNILRDNGKRLTVAKVICNGEFVSNGTRKDLADLYGAEIFVHYGAAELGGIGFECPEHTGIHINADCFILEAVRDDKEVAAGSPGNVLLTNLENEAMPLIRYEIGDIAVQEEDGKCGCGSYFPRLRAVFGRYSEGITSSDGTKIPPGMICDELETVLGIRDFQVLQKSQTKIIVKMKPRYVNLMTTEKISSYLGRLLATDLVVEIETWEDEDMPPKYRPVVSEIV